MYFCYTVAILFLQPSVITVMESNGSVQFGLILSNPSSKNLYVSIDDTSNTETGGGGEDYSSGPYTVTIPAGMTNASFMITIYDDIIFENDESFKFAINKTSLPIEVTAIDSIATVTVNIVDNDGKKIFT